MSGRWPAIVGSVIGAAITLFALVYLPMKRNHDQCGHVWLCEGQTP